MSKVGGSLFDLPDLPNRLQRWLRARPNDGHLLLAGGGPWANVVRQCQTLFGLSEDGAHDVALQTLSASAHFLAALLKPVPLIHDLSDVSATRFERAVIDPVPWFRSGNMREVPRNWNVTSDSIAALLARRLSARLLVLHKSVGNDQTTVCEAVRRGWVDAYFPNAVGDLTVGWHNLRDEVY